VGLIREAVLFYRKGRKGFSQRAQLFKDGLFLFSYFALSLPTFGWGVKNLIFLFFICVQKDDDA